MKTMIELPYLHVKVDADEAPLGMMEIENLDYYEGASIRNRVICRIDVLAGLTSCFSSENLEKCRLIIYQLISGHMNDEVQISDVFKALYLEDKQFRRLLGEVYYFDDVLKEKSMYQAVLEKILAEYNRKINYVYDFMNSHSAKILFNSHGYVYIACKDEAGANIVPSGFREEVVSRAKVWSGDFIEG